MKTSLSAFFAATLATAGLAFGAPSIAHLQKGQDLVDQIVAARKQGYVTYPVTTTTAGVTTTVQVNYNNYGGSWDGTTDASFIRFADLPHGILAGNNTRCAPFITHLMKEVYAWDWSDYTIHNPLTDGDVVTQSPAPYLLVSAIKNQVGFSQRITRLADVLPGDIAAWWDIGTDKDHAMIVVSVNTASAIAYPNTHKDAIAGLKNTTLYEVTVLDGSSTGHTVPATSASSSNRTFLPEQIDTRYFAFNGETKRWGGAGVGVIGVLVNNTSGEVVAHLWSLPTADITKGSGNAWIATVNKADLQTSRELVFGRLPADLVVVTPPVGVNLTKTSN